MLLDWRCGRWEGGSAIITVLAQEAGLVVTRVHC